MKTDKYGAYDRLNQVQLLFWQHPEQAYTTREVAEVLDVNEDTALKYLQEMSSSGRLPIVRTGWYWQLSASVQGELRAIVEPGEYVYHVLVQKVPREGASGEKETGKKL